MSKVTVTYHMPAGDSAVVEMGGFRFFDGHPLEVDQAAHPRLVAKLRINRHFEVTGGEPDAPSVSTETKAVHKGFGRFNIEQADKVLVEGLDKAAADAFNALDPDEKTARVTELLDQA